MAAATVCKASDLIEDQESGAVNSRTIFVRNLPYTLTDVQLQEVFSEIGPVRRSFIVKEKGTEQHRGFGFVQFAVVEDAIRAVQGKHGMYLHGRKIKVELAKQRASFEERRSRKHHAAELVIPADECSKMGVLASSGAGSKEKTAQKMSQGLDQSKKRKLSDQLAIQSADIKAETQQENLPRHDLSSIQKYPKKVKGGDEVKEGKSSERQRVARTVIFGGLVSPEMQEEVIDLAKRSGSVESVQTSLSLEELKGRGLEKDGCKMGAAAVVYTSVRAASLAVASLHQRSIKGGTVWARQLGGEGSKPRKWRVIIRNLPFKVTEKEVRELFSSSGFVWEIIIPQNADDQSKGFAFACFTSKADAEKAIGIANGRNVGRRPVAVDWAVSKTLYKKSAGMTEEKSEDIQENVLSDVEDQETASESDKDDLLEERENASTVRNSSPVVSGLGQETLQYDEMDLARRVLKKVASAVVGKGQESKKPKESEDELQSSKEDNNFGEKQISLKLRSEDMESLGKMSGKQKLRQGGNLQKTIFVKNLPFEADEDSVKKHFVTFGKVKSIYLVRHPQSKRPKGTAFLEFSTEEAAQAAVAAGATNGSDVVGGIMYGGRHLGVLMALDKKSAQALEKKKFEKDAWDRRNLYLAKEGKIEEGSAAADGVSEEDLQKRKQLEQEKATKLQSPNFHVSRTRLVVYNVPKTIREVDLRNLFVDAVKSRATKQQPTIKQVKILRDGKKAGKSRGIAFVEFSEHQHALVALRVLNNNPGIFTSERRPIVEFAIENLQTLKKRKERQTEQGGSVNHEALNGSHFSIKNEERLSRPNKRGRFETNNHSDEVMAGELQLPKMTERRRQTALKDFSGVENEQKRKKVKKRKNLMKMTDLMLNGACEQVGSVGEETKRPSKDLSGFQNHASINNANRKPLNKGSSIRNPSLRKQKSSYGSLNGADRGVMSEDRNLSFLGRDKQSLVSSKKINVHSPDRDLKKTNVGKKNKEKQRKRNSKPEIEDKLDKLVADYRKKYFSDGVRDLKGNIKLKTSKASNDLKRWFE